ncbi:MAG TPA: VTT domain-containing protein [Azospirillaceae bacterium]|nr:VTT domain-containing protein [Azospirillaceae bacterium]
MDAPLIDYLSGFGLAGLAALALLEKFVPLVPSYIIFALIGAALVRETGDLPAAILATTAGSVGAALIWYAIGRAFGSSRTERLVARFGGWICCDLRRYRRAMAAYRRNQFLVTLASQATPVARILMPVPAGVIGQPVRSFLPAATAGTLLWNGSLLAAGHMLGGVPYLKAEYLLAAAALAAALPLAGRMINALKARRRRARREVTG